MRHKNRKVSTTDPFNSRNTLYNVTIIVITIATSVSSFRPLSGPRNEGNCLVGASLLRPPALRPRGAAQRGPYEAMPFVLEPGKGVGTIKHRSNQ